MTSPLTFTVHLLMSLPLKTALHVSCIATAMGTTPPEGEDLAEACCGEVVGPLVAAPPEKLIGLVLVERDVATWAVARGDWTWPRWSTPALVGGGLLTRRRDAEPLLGAAMGGGSIPCTG